ncbi:hypothetical protein ENUP19_0317G0044 [Entamoeba nuttalli]|uniref:Importin alpha re-exporter, putative n=2 Tax=Entamoeba nuttalli TaxID=412467 RepID=K2GUT6_ENTNP|nr:importin alpha re-exporter, putative [Entamoeba nuttalli P19]EKE38873.1 importin alpha re-exporter, putative [Entamoeba nuttalli P19]|eukprot:XP_008858790.1 importin alpha re-exporter, putative [Entamoeba nuttalli P19]
MNSELLQLQQFIASIITKSTQGNNLSNETNLYITQIQRPEFTPLLLQLILIPNTTNSPQQMMQTQTAAIFLRQILKKYYQEENFYSSNIRGEIRKLLFQAIFSSTQLINKLLFDCFAVVANIDFPKQWPDMINLIQQTYQSGTIEQKYICIQLLSAVTKKYRTVEINNETVREIKQIVQVFPLILPLFTELNCTDKMILPILKFIHGIVSIELVDEIENNIEIVSKKLDQIAHTQQPKCQLVIFKIYNIFCSKYLDNDFLKDTMTVIIYQTVVDYLNSSQREDKNIIAGYEVLCTMNGILKIMNNDQFIQIINIIAKDISLNQEEITQINEDPEEYVKLELESEIISVKKSAGNLLNLIRRIRPDTMEFVNRGIQALQQSNIDSAIRLFIGFVVEGEIPRYGATRISEGVDLIQFWNNTVKPLFISSPQIAVIKFIHEFRSILPVTNQEYNEIFIKLYDLAIFPQVSGASLVSSMLAANTIEKMLLLKTSSNYNRAVNGINDDQLGRSFEMANKLVKNGLQLHSIYHLRAGVRILQRASKLNLPMDDMFKELVMGLINEASKEVRNNKLDGSYVGMKFEVLSTALSIGLPSIEQQLINITGEALKVDNIDVMAYLFQILTLYLPQVSSLCEPILNLQIGDRFSMITPIVKFVTSCAKKSPNVFTDEMINKALGLFQVLLQIDFIDDAFILLNGITFSIPLQRLNQIPTIISLICQRLASHQIRRLTYQLIKFILQICYISDASTIQALNIPIECGQLILTNIVQLPAEMNRPVCVVGMMKLFSLSPFNTLMVNNESLNCLMQSVLETLKNKRIIDFVHEDIKDDKTTNLATIKYPHVDPEIKNLNGEIKTTLSTLCTTPINTNGQSVVLRQLLTGNTLNFYNEVMSLPQ